MLNFNSIEYHIYIYSTIIDAINFKLKNPQGYWFKVTHASEPIGYSNIIKMSDEQIIEFVHDMVLIRGSIDTSSIKGLEYKKIVGGRFFLSLDLDLQFDSEEEKLKYIEFHKYVVGIRTSSILLDEVLA